MRSLHSSPTRTPSSSPAARTRKSSAAGAALSLELLGCVDEDTLVDLFVEALAGSGQDFDEDCVREKLEEFDVADIVAASQGAEPPADVVAAMVSCVSGG